MHLRWGPRRQRSPRLPADAPDLIGALPDDLLLLVLARLDCAAAAARTGVLSRRWRGLWPRLRRIVFNNVALPSVEAALGRFSPPPSAVSLIQIRFPNPRGRVPTEHLECCTGRVTSLLRAAVRLDPEELSVVLPSGTVSGTLVLDLPSFHSATSIVLDTSTIISRVLAGVQLPALEKLSLSRCTADLGALLSRCPRLRTLHLSHIWSYNGLFRVKSPLLQELVVARGKHINRVNIVAPMLKQLTISLNVYPNVKISVLAPMLEKVSWDCYLCGPPAKLGLWRLEQLSLQMRERQGSSLHIHASSSTGLHGEADKFTQAIEKHMVAAFSVLELHLITKGHVYGPLVFHLLGMNRIRCAMQKLKVNIERMFRECLPHCACDSPNWRSQTISLTTLEEVEINSFEGDEHEIDFLKFIFKCAPMLKRMIVKLSHEASPNRFGLANISDIFMAYSSVECYVYHSSGQCMSAKIGS